MLNLKRTLPLLLLCLLPAGRPAQAPSPADVTAATAAAQAGLLDAETKLKAALPVHYFDVPPHAWRYWGADATEITPPAPSDPVQGAVNPSFAVEVDVDPASADPTPRTLTIGGDSRGYSGVHAPGSYATNGNLYSLKVSDLSGRLYVNDGLVDGPAGSVSQNLKRLLNVLGRQLGETALGDRILAGRPVGGYASLDALLPALGSQESLDRVRDYLTAHAWVDRNVANPVPLSQIVLNRYPVQYYRGPAGNRIYRYASSIDSSGQEGLSYLLADTNPNAGPVGPGLRPEVTVYGLDQLNPEWIEIVGRAPVNVNAAPREVLVALLADLQGFYIAERKRNNPRWEGELLLSLHIQSTYNFSVNSNWDVYGVLTETFPIVGPGSSQQGISAHEIANEIIACRERRASAAFNYASVPWSGPFRSWHQFNLFVDNLIPIGVLKDPRSIHVRYAEEGADPMGYNNLIPDEDARAQGVRAIADVIKANFNPNLHLNELNPDANLHTLVDKTDLFINSTEFCFVPSGYFEVESVGKVLRPTGGQADALLASNNELMAQVKTVAVLKLYDQYRESTQKQFYAGSVTSRSTATDTSNDGTLEIGPEPDNGVFPGNLGAAGAADNEWDGYVALPTVGGPWHANPLKAKNTLVATTSFTKAPQFTSSMHSHFGLDMDACDHPGTRSEIAGRSLGADDTVSNYPSRVNNSPLFSARPNDPTKGDHRLARSFRIDGGAPPSLPQFAPSDLRLDGAYAERNSAPAYYAHETSGIHLWDFNTQNATGMFSFWVKPSFTPELTGKIRKFWDMSRHHSPCSSGINVWPFALVFQPVQYNDGISDAVGPQFWHNNMGKFPSRSMYFGSMQWHTDDQFTTGSAHQFGKITKSLNHINHSDQNGSPNPLQAHQWVNITCSWNLNNTSDPTGNRSQLYINGSSNWSQYSYTSMTGGWAEGFNRMNGFNKHSGGEFNQMRLGGTSLIGNAAKTLAGSNAAYKGNHSSDATIDEFFAWPNDSQSPDLLWLRGRYFNLKNQAGGEGRFTSQAFGLTPAPGPVKILGASWTWYGDGADPLTADRTLQDYGGLYTGFPVRDLQPKVLLSVIDGGLTFGPYAADGLSPVLNTGGVAPTIANPAQVRYSVHFQHTTASIFPVLVTTPVFDDVTLYWTNGAPSGVVTTSPPVVVTDPPSSTGGGGGGGGGGCGLLGLEALLLLALIRKPQRH